MQFIMEVMEDFVCFGKFVYKKVQLVGLGDVIGIKVNVVVWIELWVNVGNFEFNYFLYIEFYEEDFFWCYILACSVDGKLCLWLVFVVLEEVEFECWFLFGVAFFVIINGQLLIVFLLVFEIWAWAYVQVNEFFFVGNEMVVFQ